jgi:Sulfatase
MAVASAPGKMTQLVHALVGLALALSGWLIPRRVAGARITSLAALLVDLLPVLLGWGLLLTMTGRPVFAGVAILAAGAGLALADQAKRDTLREPVVFSDMSELPQVFTHPQLYLPFAGTGLVLGGAAVALTSGAALFLLEPELWRPGPLLVLLPPALVVALGWAMARQPALGWVAAALRRLGPSGEPLDDIVRLGPFATLFAHGMIAAAERPARRARVTAPAIARGWAGRAAPLVLVQCESFFDARRLSPLVPQDLLPGFDAGRGAGATFGRLAVPGWGANTMRAEFAVLTGIGDDELGLDRFNPYHAFVRVRIPSLAWRLQQEGYRTICLHPFDRRFFRRDRAMPALGFESFLGRESLGGGRRPPYCPDPELARRILETLETAGPRVFLFAITMGNHGPWSARGEPTEEAVFAADGVPGAGELQRYLAGLRRSDEMIEILLAGLQDRPEAVLGFYGDHLPSLPRAFGHFGFDEWASDYFLWRNASAAPRNLDVPAHRLPALILDTLAAPRRTAPLAAGC